MLAVWGEADTLKRVHSRGGSELGTRILSRIRGDARLWSMVTIPKNASVYNCGKPDRALYVVESGLVKTVMASRGGKECLLDISIPGDVMGESSLLGGERTESAVAMSDSTLMRIPADDFFAVLDEEGLTGSFLRYVIGRIVEHQQAITRFVTVNSEVRLAVTLMRLGRKLGQAGRPKHRSGRSAGPVSGTFLYVNAKITQEELAEMVGTTRTRIGVFLKKFCEMGLITYDSRSFLAIDELRMLSYLNDVTS